MLGTVVDARERERARFVMEGGEIYSNDLK
jgi:hypothetical protein